MSKWLLVLLPFLGGLAGGAQAPINGGLGRRIGAAEATLFSFTIGALAAGLLVFLAGKGEFGKLLGAPWWQLIGGLLGVCFVYAIILAVPHLGAGATLFAAIAGQTAFGLAADHFGLFGLQRIPMGSLRIAGLALMLAGAGMIALTRR